MQIIVDANVVNATTGGRPHQRGQTLLVFLHGAGGDRTVWSLQTRYFASHGWNVLAVDLPGHSGSEGPAIESIDELAKWLLRLLDATGYDHAAVVGHSMGSFIALAAASKAPDRIERLAMIGTAATMPVHPDLLDAAQRGDHRAIELVVGWSFTAHDHLGGHPTPGMWMSGSAIRLMEHVERGILGVDLAACNAYDGAIAAAGKVTSPTLLLLGAADRMTRPRAAEPLAAAFANCTTVTIEGAGHQMMWDAPDGVIDALAAFLSQP